jgi:hypothetical protein
MSNFNLPKADIPPWSTFATIGTKLRVLRIRDDEGRAVPGADVQRGKKSHSRPHHQSARAEQLAAI